DAFGERRDGGAGRARRFFATGPGGARGGRGVGRGTRSRKSPRGRLGPRTIQPLRRVLRAPSPPSPRDESRTGRPAAGLLPPMRRLAVSASKRFDIGIVGSGFAGSLLALVCRRLGRSVVVIERGSHPRFAIGESSSPLANLLLEELCDRY